MSREPKPGIAASVVLLVFSLLIAAFGSAEIVASRYASQAGTRGGRMLDAASTWSPLDWRYPLKLATIERATRDNDAALGLYARALADNPACAQCRIGVAEIAAELGRDPDPWIDSAVQFGTADTLVRTRAAVLYATLGRPQDAMREFRASVAGHRTDRMQFFALLHRIYDDADVLDRIVPDSVMDAYFDYARRNLSPSSMEAVWERYAGLGYADEGRERYVDFLLRHGLVHRAWEIAFPDQGVEISAVLDGDFESVGGSSGRFAWRLQPMEGVRPDIVPCPTCEKGGHALRVRFGGETNVDFRGITHIAPVTGGRDYRLSFYVMASDLTSARGPSVLVEGVMGWPGDATAGCKFRAESPDFRGTSPWRQTTVDFSVPPECEGVRIVVHRPRTRRLNKFIAGEFWIDDVRLDPVSAATEDPSEHPTGAALPAVDGGSRTRLHPVQGGGRGLSRQKHLGSGGDQLDGLITDDGASAGQRLGQARGTPVA